MRAVLILALLALSPLAGCSLLGRTPDTTIAPHVVFLAPEGCGTAVAKIHRGGYALLATVEDGYTMQLGDVLEGPSREGESIFRHFPPAARNGEWADGIPVPIDILATDLMLADARQRLDAICVVEGEPLPRLPGTVAE